MGTTISGVSSMAMRLILAELARRYEAATGVVVAITAMGGVDAAKRARAGEAADIVILAGNVMAQLEAEGHVVPGSVQGLARSGMAVAVREGAERPDIGDEAAVRRAIGAAGKVGYSTGPSGEHLLGLYARWGLPQDHLVKAPPGVAVASLLAEGQADLGFQQLSELIDVPGIAVVGPLPPEIQAVTLFAAGVCSTSLQQTQTRDLIAYFASPATDDVKRGQGMEPA